MRFLSFLFFNKKKKKERKFSFKNGPPKPHSDYGPENSWIASALLWVCSISLIHQVELYNKERGGETPQKLFSAFRGANMSWNHKATGPTVLFIQAAKTHLKENHWFTKAQRWSCTKYSNKFKDMKVVILSFTSSERHSHRGGRRGKDKLTNWGCRGY